LSTCNSGTIGVGQTAASIYPRFVVSPPVSPKSTRILLNLYACNFSGCPPQLLDVGSNLTLRYSPANGAISNFYWTLIQWTQTHQLGSTQIHRRCFSTFTIHSFPSLCLGAPKGPVTRDSPSKTRGVVLNPYLGCKMAQICTQVARTAAERVQKWERRAIAWE